MAPKRRSRMFAVAVAAAVGVVAMAACVKSESKSSSATSTPGTLPVRLVNDGGAPVRGGTLVYGMTAEVNSYSPNVGQWTDYTVPNAIMDPLAAYNKDGVPKPYLAESMTPNGDFTEWTIKVRPGISFHNGEKLDAVAVKQNFDAFKNAALTGQAFALVQQVNAEGDLTVRVKMSAPWSTFPHILTGQPGYMVAPKQLTDDPQGNAPIGTGPFKLLSWDKNSLLKVERNPNYWRGNDTPYLDGINFRPITDIQTRVQALDTGAADIIQIGTPAELLSLNERAQRGEVQMVTDDTGETSEIFIALNKAVEPFNDPVAREAVIRGLDLPDLSQTAFNGAFPAAYGPFAPGSPSYIPPEQSGYPKYDLEKAKALAKQYQDTHGKPLSFSALIPTSPEYAAIAETLQQRAKDAGIDVKLEKLDQSQLVARVVTGNYQASGFILFGSPSLDREYVFIASKSKPPGEFSLNVTHNDDPALTGAMDEARKTDDPQKQAEQYKIVQQQMAKDMTFAFLVHARSALVFNTDVHGVEKATLPNGEPTLPSTTPFSYAIFKKKL